MLSLIAAIRFFFVTKKYLKFITLSSLHAPPATDFNGILKSGKNKIHTIVILYIKKNHTDNISLEIIFKKMKIKDYTDI